MVSDFPKIFSQNRRLLSEPPVGFERASYQMEMSITACDPEKERPRKILQPEIDLAQDFQNVALARVLFAESTFFEKISISGQRWRQKLRIRIREAVAGTRIYHSVLREDITSCGDTAPHAILMFTWYTSRRTGRSASSCPPRGNTVDGLPRAHK